MVIVKKEAANESKPPAAASEQLENLSDLANQAVALDAADAVQPGAPSVAVQLPSVALRDEVEATLKLVREIILPVLPEHQRNPIAAAWDDKRCALVAQAAAPVMELHGVTMGGLMGKYGPYIALAASVAPAALETVRIVRTAQPTSTQPKDGQQPQA
jgi:hypothetical protein